MSSEIKKSVSFCACVILSVCLGGGKGGGGDILLMYLCYSRAVEAESESSSICTVSSINIKQLYVLYDCVQRCEHTTCVKLHY